MKIRCLPLILLIISTTRAASLCDDLDAAPSDQHTGNTPVVLVSQDGGPVAGRYPPNPFSPDVSNPNGSYGPSMSYVYGMMPRIVVKTGESAPQKTENYAHYEPNPVQRVSDVPVSTFSIDVDSGSYSNVRRMIAREGRLPPADAVRTEEILNYFNYDYPPPQDGKPFAIYTQIVDSPWKRHDKLLRIAIRAADLALEKRPPANLVFLIDTSATMDAPDKLLLVKKTVCHFAEALRADDRITLIAFSDDVRELLPPTSGDQKEKIVAALKPLRPHGMAAGVDALHLAYQAVREHYQEDGINRILLASDGDFNRGISNLELRWYIGDQRGNHIGLTILGFGTGNYNDALLETLADKADNGSYHYIDSEAEAKKVLVRQLTPTLTTIARDVKIRVEFNPETVKEYRLVGYENRLLHEDYYDNDDENAGDIGAGGSVTALYAITPQEKPYWGVASRYQQPLAGDKANEYGWLNLRYKDADDGERQPLEQPVMVSSIPLEDADASTRLAIAAASYAQALKDSEQNGALDWAGILRLAQSAKGEDPHGERAGLIALIEKAQSLSAGK